MFYFKVCFGLLLLMPSAALAQEKPLDPAIQKMVDEYTLDLSLDEKMIARGMRDESDRALHYLNRGKVYWKYTKKLDLAEQDFSHAIASFDGNVKADETIRRLRATEAFLYRAICRKELGKLKDAERDATKAVDGFERLYADSKDLGDAMQVYALKVRAEIRTGENATKEMLAGAVADYRSATKVLQNLIAKKTKQEVFYKEEVVELAERIERTLKRLSTSKSDNQVDN